MSHFSIMIPVYNRENIVGKTIESVLNQTYSDFGLTILDDGSTDSTVEVIKRYLYDKRIKIIINQENLGLTKNWNKCFELAEGPLVQILQSDDLIDRNYLQIVNDIFENHPDVGFVSAACRHIDVKGKILDYPKETEDKYFSAGDEALTAMLTTGFPHVSSIIIRKSILNQIGKINEEIWHGPDVEFDARLASKHNYYKIGKVYTSFRRHGTNRGNLEYFRRDYLPNHILKFSLAWGYLSKEGLRKLGIQNLATYINKNAAEMAIGGSILMIAYGRTDLGKFYLINSIKLHLSSIYKHRFWKALFLNIFPNFGQKIMVRRLQISQQDLHTIRDSKLQ